MNPTKKSCLVLIVALAVTLEVTAGGESEALLQLLGKRVHLDVN